MMSIEITFSEFQPDSYYSQITINHPDTETVYIVESFIYSHLKFFDAQAAYEAKRLGIRGGDYYVEFYDKVNRTIPVGLIPRMSHALLKQYGSNCKILLSDGIREMFTPPKRKVTMDEIRGYANALHIHNRSENIPITAYDHQIQLAMTALNKRRVSLLACTSAGKSLSMMIIARYLVEREHRKVLIIVPSTNLVEQLFSDFYDDYGWDEAKNHCTLIHGTSSDKLKKKDKERLALLNIGEEAMLKDITISTWQSLQPKLNPDKPSYNPDFFKVFDAVLVDEAHGTRGDSIRAILSACSNANDFKVGVSGTIPDDGLDACLIEGALGRKEEIVRLHTLIEKKILTPVEVHAVFIPYPMNLRPAICRQNLENETKIITNNSSRKDVMTALINAGKITTDENTVVLFKAIANLEDFLNYMKTTHPNFTYHVIKGDVGTEAREAIRKSINKSRGNMIIATYGCMKQGVNIKLLHNLVMADPAKSMYMVVQSIGRIVRPHPEKPLARVFDFVDNASYYTKPRNGAPPSLQTNGMIKHFLERKKYYDADYIPIKNINLEGLYVAPITIDSLDAKRKAAADSGKPVKTKKTSYKKKFFL